MRCPAREGRQLRFEAGGVDDAVEGDLLAVDDHTPLGDPLDARGAVDEGDVVAVERGEVLVVEAGSLAEVAVVRLEALGHPLVVDELAHPGAVLLHHRVVELLDLERDVADGHALGDLRIRDFRHVVGPAVVDEVALRRHRGHDRREVLHAPPLPPGLEVVGEVVRRRPVAAHADGRRRALEHVQVFRRLRERGHRLDRAAPGADDPDDLVAELVEVRIVRSATRVAVVPARAVEGSPAEGSPAELLHARDRRELHQVEDSGRDD